MMKKASAKKAHVPSSRAVLFIQPAYVITGLIPRLDAERQVRGRRFSKPMGGTRNGGVKVHLDPGELKHFPPAQPDIEGDRHHRR